MPDSLIIDWLDENSFRTYPLLFQNSPLVLPNNILLDAQFVFNSVDDASNTSYVNLTSINETAGEYTITVSAEVNAQSTFRFSASSVSDFPLYVYNDQGSLLVIGAGILSLTGNNTFTTLTFEPSTIIDISSGWEGLPAIVVEGQTTVELNGEVLFEEGTQVYLLASGPSEITIKVGRNLGLPVDCSPKFTTTFAQDCNEGISNLNGTFLPKRGADFKIEGGDHISIFNDPVNHRIYIGLTFSSSDICPAILPTTQPHG